MSLTFKRDGVVLPFDDKLYQLLAEQAKQKGVDTAKAKALVFNFRDPYYCAEQGGYHPVEIRIERQVDGHWIVTYITDFSYSGGSYPELVKDSDWDIEAGVYYSAWTSAVPIASSIDFFMLYQCNFLAYVEQEVFDITVSFED